MSTLFLFLGLPLCSTYGQFAACSAFFGVFAGSFYANAPLVYSESFPASMESALGLSCALRAAAALLLAPVIGGGNIYSGQ